MTSLARLAQLWRYPVKSMLGETREHLDIDARGVTGDRVFAVRDAHGKLGSGKDTRRFRRIDGLLGFHAHLPDGVPEIRFPDGRIMRADEAGIGHALSETLGEALHLTRESDVSHLDAGPIHILTTASLRHLQSALPDLHIDPRRFRPNIVVDGTDAGMPEFDWIGHTLEIGGSVVLRVTATTERCRMTTLAQDELPDEPLILRGIAQHANLQFGVYAEVIRSGRINVGDSVRLRG